MLKLIIQKNKKGEPTGKLIVESVNDKTKTPYNFKYAAANALVLMPGQLVDLILSIKSQQSELNKITRAYAAGKVVKVEVTEFGEKLGGSGDTTPKTAEQIAADAKELGGA